MKLSTRKRSGNSRTFRKLQPTQIDYSRNSGVLRWRRSLLPVQKSRMCSLQKSNKHAHLLHRPAPAGRRQVWLAPTVSQNHPYRSRNGPAKCLLVKREHYVIFRNDHVCHYVSCLPVTPTTRLEYACLTKFIHPEKHETQLSDEMMKRWYDDTRTMTWWGDAVIRWWYDDAMNS